MPILPEHPVSSEPHILQPIRCEYCPGILERIHAVELHVMELQEHRKDLDHELTRLINWVRQDSERSRWFYQAEHDLRDMVESKRWVYMSKKIVAWLAGTLVGAVLTWQHIEEWIKVHKWWGH